VIRYLDTSAAAKLVLAEPGAAALREAARSWQSDDLVAGQVMATQLRRLTARLAVSSEVADAVLGVVELVDMERDDFILAATLPPPTARTHCTWRSPCGAGWTRW
jgi:predicted nucleic acid-binding protein